MLKGGYDKGKRNEPEYKKKCNNCGVLKNKIEFDINQIQAGDRLVRRGECKVCRQWKKPIPTKAKNEFIKKNPRPIIGVSFLCPICKKSKPVLNKTSVVLDHNHETGEIRGYVCLACNTGMGNLRDDINVLKRAILWIKKLLKH